MAKRKTTRLYAFRGHFLKLEERIARCKAKLADPIDADDKRWLARGLRAAERRLVEKEPSFEAKNYGRRDAKDRRSNC